MQHIRLGGHVRVRYFLGRNWLFVRDIGYLWNRLRKNRWQHWLFMWLFWHNFRRIFRYRHRRRKHWVRFFGNFRWAVRFLIYNWWKHRLLGNLRREKRTLRWSVWLLLNNWGKYRLLWNLGKKGVFWKAIGRGAFRRGFGNERYLGLLFNLMPTGTVIHILGILVQWRTLVRDWHAGMLVVRWLVVVVNIRVLVMWPQGRVRVHLCRNLL